jgi:hypothetical protein
MSSVRCLLFILLNLTNPLRRCLRVQPSAHSSVEKRGCRDDCSLAIQSECCVLSTCRGALASGFNVVLLEGAHSTYDLDGKLAGAIEGEVESQLERAGAKVVPWESWKLSASFM